MTGSQPQVSVIIPVRDDAQRLALCLAALARQSYPAERFEVLVVDNGSRQPPEEVVATMDRARLLHEPQPGSYAARNRGLEEATGELLAFTDADCQPEPEWLAAGVAALLEDPGTGLVAGAVEVFVSDEARPTAVELYELATAFPQRFYVERMCFGATANVFTRRSVFEQVGSFDGSLLSGGDAEWGRRVWRAGYPLAFCAAAVVRHPARVHWAEMAAKARRVARGHRRLEAGEPWRHRLTAAARRWLPPVRELREIWRSRRLRGPGQRLRAAAVAVFFRYLRAAQDFTRQPIR